MGVDDNPLLVWAARWRARRLRNARFFRGDLFSCPLASDSDVVLVCLVPAMMERLSATTLTQLRKNTLVLSARFEIPDMVALECVLPGGPIDGVWLYRKS